MAQPTWALKTLNWRLCWTCQGNKNMHVFNIWTELIYTRSNKSRDFTTMGSLTDITSAERDAFYPAQLAAALWLVETRIRLLSGLSVPGFIQVSCIKKIHLKCPVWVSTKGGKRGVTVTRLWSTNHEGVSYRNMHICLMYLYFSVQFQVI